MKALIIILCILVVNISHLTAQNPVTPTNTTDRLIEGGNLIVEILKVINGNGTDKSKTKKSQDADCATKNFTNICFINRYTGIILVNLKEKESVQEYDLIIANNGKECCYRIAPGIYTYSISRQKDGFVEDQLIRKGEILLEVCNDLEIKIK